MGDFGKNGHGRGVKMPILWTSFMDGPQGGCNLQSVLFREAQISTEQNHNDKGKRKLFATRLFS